MKTMIQKLDEEMDRDDDAGPYGRRKSKPNKKMSEALNPKPKPKTVNFRQGLIVQVSGVMFRIKRIKLSKNEMTLRQLTPGEVKQVEVHIKKQEEKKLENIRIPEPKLGGNV